MAATFRAATQAAIPTATSTPTEAPDPVLEASQSLPEGSGTFTKEGEQWIFNSPEGVEAGKNVSVQWLKHTYEDETTQNWIALVDNPGWPLFVQNEAGEWQTALEYMDVKRPLVDTKGNPVALTCEDDGTEGFYGDSSFTASCFFVVKGLPFYEDDIAYIPVAIPLDGQYYSPMATLNVPVDLWGGNKVEYSNRVYNPILVARSANRNSILPLLKQGDVFWLQFLYDSLNLDVMIEDYKNRGQTAALVRQGGKKENREKARALLRSVSSGTYNSPILKERLDLWIPADFGIGTGN